MKNSNEKIGLMRMLRMIGSIRTMKNIITKGRIKDRKYIRNLGAVRNIRSNLLKIMVGVMLVLSYSICLLSNTRMVYADIIPEPYDDFFQDYANEMEYHLQTRVANSKRIIKVYQTSRLIYRGKFFLFYYVFIEDKGRIKMAQRLL